MARRVLCIAIYAVDLLHAQEEYLVENGTTDPQYDQIIQSIPDIVNNLKESVCFHSEENGEGARVCFIYWQAVDFCAGEEDCFNSWNNGIKSMTINSPHVIVESYHFPDHQRFEESFTHTTGASVALNVGTSFSIHLKEQMEHEIPPNAICTFSFYDQYGAKNCYKAGDVVSVKAESIKSIAFGKNQHQPSLVPVLNGTENGLTDIPPFSEVDNFIVPWKRQFSRFRIESTGPQGEVDMKEDVCLFNAKDYSNASPKSRRCFKLGDTVELDNDTWLNLRVNSIHSIKFFGDVALEVYARRDHSTPKGIFTVSIPKLPKYLRKFHLLKVVKAQKQKFAAKGVVNGNSEDGNDVSKKCCIYVLGEHVGEHLCFGPGEYQLSDFGDMWTKVDSISLPKNLKLQKYKKEDSTSLVFQFHQSVPDLYKRKNLGNMDRVIVVERN